MQSFPSGQRGEGGEVLGQANPEALSGKRREGRFRPSLFARPLPNLSGSHEAYTRALQDAGPFVAGSRLQTTHSASTIRVRDGKSQVLDGPYAETKEQLGGYYLIEAETLDAAIEWAARCPGAAYGAIEVRPLWQMTA